jgi:hypothetical protein
MTNKVVDFTLRQQQQPSPLETLKVLTDLQASVRAANPAPAPSDPILNLLFEQNRTLMGIITAKLTEPPPQQPATPTRTVEAGSVIDSAIQIAEKLGYSRNSPAGDGGPHWAEILKEPLTIVAQSLTPVLNAAAYRLAPAPPGNHINTAPPGPPGYATAVPDRAGTLPPGPAPPQAQPQQPQQPTSRAEQLGQLVLSCIERGIPGSSLAVTIDVQTGGRSTYLALASAGKENLKLALRAQPAVWQRLEPIQDTLDTFLEEFLHAFDEEETTADALDRPTAAA